MKDDIYLCSYPRSGNTWTRLLLSDIFMQCNGLQTDSKNVLDLSDRIIPDMHCCDINDLEDSVKLPFRIIKTHNAFQSNFKKSIFLFRAPADALTSYFHFLFGTENLEEKYHNDIDLFVLDMIKNYNSYSKSFLDAKSQDMLFISYEELHLNPHLAMQRVLKFLDYMASDDVIAKAINNHTFEKHKGTWQLKTEDDKGGAFFRKGKIGSSLQELKEDTLKKIDANEIYEDMLQIEKNQINDFNVNI